MKFSMKFSQTAAVLMASALMLMMPRVGYPQQSPSYDAEQLDSDRADAAVEKHAKAIKKIPHVVDIDSDQKESGEIVILVTVDNKKNVDEVARKVPPRIDGFAVDVVVDEASDGAGGISSLSSDSNPGPLQTGNLKAAEPTATATPGP
jgi:hypothetical protein